MLIKNVEKINEIKGKGTCIGIIKTPKGNMSIIAVDKSNGFST
ncbi:hypothetical protein [uncultured Arcobacter sp.]|nr:hypothetical protein [uncultured Arcobacter sp.]